MKTFQKSLLLLAVSLFFAATGFAQTKSIAQKADDLFNQKQYIAALQKYEEAYNKISSNKAEKNRCYFQMGECYRLMNNFPKAERVYKRLINQKYYTTEPKLYYYMAEMYRFENKFDEADEYYGKYLELVPDDKLAQQRKASIIYVNQLFMNRTRHNIVKLDKWSTDYNDWAPRFMGDDTTRLVFTSSRFGDDDGKHDAWTGQAFSDFYTVFQDRKGNWSDAVENFDNSKVINSPVNEGEAWFSPDGRTVYFSRCDSREHETQGCYVYYSKKGGASLDDKPGRKGKKDDNAEANGDWSEPVKINLGDTMYNYLYPTLSRDQLTMYFSSDMPNGYGDYDLWVATRKSVDDDFGTPVNLGGTVNSAGREVFPTLRNDSTIYFSSNGLPGVGGLDIFRSTKNGRKWSTPENLGIPINSSYDEMSIIYYPESQHYMMERGY
ncbi:MAG: tetratricopeptide repeat protein, partial [Bacteroidales bacterium]|nr:tetratricopeptide repeat protein [Bacteroidales bacterium]